MARTAYGERDDGRFCTKDPAPGRHGAPAERLLTDQPAPRSAAATSQPAWHRMTAQAVEQAVRRILEPLSMPVEDVEESISILQEEAAIVGSASDVHDAVGFLLPPDAAITLAEALFEALKARRKVTRKRPQPPPPSPPPPQ